MVQLYHMHWLRGHVRKCYASLVHRTIHHPHNYQNIKITTVFQFRQTVNNLFVVGYIVSLTALVLSLAILIGFRWALSCSIKGMLVTSHHSLLFQEPSLHQNSHTCPVVCIPSHGMCLLAGLVQASSRESQYNGCKSRRTTWFNFRSNLADSWS